MGYSREGQNEYQTPISVFVCDYCEAEFTICPAVPRQKRKVYERAGCGSAECDSYTPAQDANVLFGDYSMFLLYCERKGIPPETASAPLLAGRISRETIDEK